MDTFKVKTEKGKGLKLVIQGVDIKKQKTVLEETTGLRFGNGPYNFQVATMFDAFLQDPQNIYHKKLIDVYHACSLVMAYHYKLFFNGFIVQDTGTNRVLVYVPDEDGPFILHVEDYFVAHITGMDYAEGQMFESVLETDFELSVKYGEVQVVPLEDMGYAVEVKARELAGKDAKTRAAMIESQAPDIRAKLISKFSSGEMSDYMGAFLTVEQFEYLYSGEGDALKKAIEIENYEVAAKLRDGALIRELGERQNKK